MKTARSWLGLAAVAGLALCSACRQPKYALYTSPQGDWRAAVPWGWNVMVDRDQDRYTAVNFIGPFDPDFFLGAPSMQVRWYAYRAPHIMADGLIEVYASANDYIEQTLRKVYGPEYQLVQPVHEIKMDRKRLRAQHFVVLSGAPADPNAQWGLEEEVDTGRRMNVRQHAYVVLPMRTGFYVLIYPATRRGYKTHEGQFNQLVNTFAPLKQGPGGPEIERPETKRLVGRAKR